MKKGIYFPNLNGLRFIAPFMVILHHYELSRQINSNTFYGRFIYEIGPLGVILFFTLSGFLITYLLLVERNKTGKVDIKKFYVRRILRIWPLYYLIVLGSLYLFNNVMYLRIPGVSYMVHDNFLLKNILFILMLPNIAISFGLELPFADQTWSIGVEEQFYLLWPFLFNKISNTLRLILAVIGIYILVKLLFYILNLCFPGELSTNIYHLISISSFDSMAFGGLAALLFFEKSSVVKYLFKKPVQLIFFLILLLCLLFGVDFHFFQSEFYSILFAFLIVNLAGNKQVIFSLENNVLNYLGKISFGLYMYHFLAIRFGDLLLTRISNLNHWLQFIIVLIVTIMISACSYEMFEKYFIRKKKAYSNIISGDNVIVKGL